MLNYRPININIQIFMKGLNPIRQFFEPIVEIGKDRENQYTVTASCRGEEMGEEGRKEEKKCGKKKVRAWERKRERKKRRRKKKRKKLR